jgi:hypothetical protein
MATIDEFALKNIGLWWRYGISRHCDEWKYIIIGRIFESEIILIPPSLKISERSFNGSYRNTDEVWWRYGISRSCDECFTSHIDKKIFLTFLLKPYLYTFSLYENPSFIIFSAETEYISTRSWYRNINFLRDRIRRIF